MNEIKHNYKLEIFKRGRKIRHLSEELGMPYNRLSRVLNGYDCAPEGFAMKFRDVLNKWDRQRDNVKEGRI